MKDMNDIKPDKFKTNPFAKKYKATLEHRQMDRDAKQMGGSIPGVMRRDAMSKAKKK